MNLALFRRTRELERQIDAFYEKLSESAVVFRLAIRTYLKERASEDFEARLQRVNEMESEADALRREIERQLYQHMLIPDSRGDVLGLIETSDAVLSQFETVLWAFSIERPDIPGFCRSGYRRLTNMVVKAVDELVLGARAFFYSPHDVPAHNHKVMLFEKEADAVCTQLKREIFGAGKLDLCRKMHLREMAEHIDSIADMAEDVADRLSIYAIKRMV